jgi:hypothetical protein
MTRLTITVLMLAFAAAMPVDALAVELEVTGLDGRVTRGRLVQLVPEIIVAAPDEEVAFAWTDILAVRPLGAVTTAPAAASDEPLRFELVDGSRFRGRIDHAADSGFVVRFRSDQTCRLEPGALRSIASSSASREALDMLGELSAVADRSEDLAVIQRGAQVLALSGAIRRVDAERVIFLWKDRELPLPWERIAGLGFARSTPRRSTCSVRLPGGEEFGGRVVGGSEAGVVLQSAVFDHLRLPWSDVDRVDCRSERVAFLSDLVPAEYEFTPFFEKQWEYARDRTLMGRPIRVGGREYEKGLTMHSRSSLTYELDGRFRQFAAVVGIADEMDGRGDVTLAVVGDGRVLWDARNVVGGGEPREVLVDVTGVRALSLHVGFGEGLDLSDHACWAMARLIR